MKGFLFLVILIAALVGGGMVFLSSWDIPPPSSEVIKRIPNERFQR